MPEEYATGSGPPHASHDCVGTECFDIVPHTLNNIHLNYTRPEFITLFAILFFGVFSISLIGNGLVCFIVCSRPRMRTPTNYFIVSIAIVDLLFTILYVPSKFISMLVTRHWPFGELICKVVNYTQAGTVYVNAYWMVAVASDWHFYIIIILVLKPSVEVNKRAIAVFWVGSLATALCILTASTVEKPSLWHEFYSVDECQKLWPSSEKDLYYFIVIIQYVFPLVMLVFYYSNTVYAIWHLGPTREYESKEDEVGKPNKKKIVMLISIALVFFINWSPVDVLWILQLFYEDSTFLDTNILWVMSMWMAMTHACYSPILYYFMDTDFRSEFKRVLRMKIKESAVGTGGRQPQIMMELEDRRVPHPELP